MNFIHIITTRFNVPTEIWSQTRSGKKPLTEEWLRDRFEIFLKYSLASFKNQSNQNFIWLVFFDKETPEKYQKEIEKIKQSFPLFHPLFVRDFQEMHRKAIEIIPSFFAEQTQFIITSDIDNDDILHKDYIATVQKKFEPKHNLVIDLKRGLQLTKISQDKAFVNEFYMVANPFVSLVESKSDFGTIMKEEHLKYRHYENYTFFDDEPRFIQYIHSYNLVNNSELNAKRLYNLTFSDYGIAKENEFKISKVDAIYYNIKRKCLLLKSILIKK